MCPSWFVMSRLRAFRNFSFYLMFGHVLNNPANGKHPDFHISKHNPPYKTLKPRHQLFRPSILVRASYLDDWS